MRNGKYFKICEGPSSCGEFITMQEIGGYFELETNHFEEHHKGALKLNSGSACLKQIIRTYKIKKILVPEFTCPVVWKSIRDENCECLFYKVGLNFMPQQDFGKDNYVLYNNYFGINGRNVRILEQQYRNLIVDNAQAFYSFDNSLASFYSARKFFGVPDGGYLYCRDEVNLPDTISESWNKCTALLKRCDRPASEGYADYKESEHMIAEEPVSRMSKLTECMLRSIDYEAVRKKRIENYQYLHEQLGKYNQIDADLNEDDVPMVYPFLTDKDGLRESLIANKIYVATYWPGSNQDEIKRIVPLPIDQRYEKSEIDCVIEKIEDFFGIKKNSCL